MSIPILDPFGVTTDLEMPFMARALNPLEARWRLGRLLLPAGEENRLWLDGIRVVRHKPGRRCLVEYDVERPRPGAAPERMTLIGKARAKGLDGRGYRTQASLYDAGFGSDSEDGISVPEPVGTVPEFRMWLQRKAPGVPATSLLARPDEAVLGQRLATAAHKLHRGGVPPLRRPHGVADELRILRERLPLVARTEPRWEERIQRVLGACERLASSIPKPSPKGIHRDFYPDQVLVDGERLYLLDLDLYCEGDPALDIGNFLGHLEEQSLRTLGDAAALTDCEEALEERFLELSGDVSSDTVRAYTTLTLARHVHISTLFEDRRRFTGALLELCEERLGTPSRA